MTFLLSIFLIGGVIWLAVAIPGFRRVLAASGLLLLAVVLYVVVSSHGSTVAREREEEASKHRIPLSQVQFEDLSIGGFSESSTIMGRVRNMSPTVTLVGTELAVTVQDCVPDQHPKSANVDGKADKSSSRKGLTGVESVWVPVNEICETVGQANVTPYTMEVPPMQSRAFDEHVHFSSLPPAKGIYRWDYKVVFVQGKPK